MRRARRPVVFQDSPRASFVFGSAVMVAPSVRGKGPMCGHARPELATIESSATQHRKHGMDATSVPEAKACPHGGAPHETSAEIAPVDARGEELTNAQVSPSRLTCARRE